MFIQPELSVLSSKLGELHDRLQDEQGVHDRHKGRVRPQNMLASGNRYASISKFLACLKGSARLT